MDLINFIQAKNEFNGILVNQMKKYATAQLNKRITFLKVAITTKQGHIFPSSSQAIFRKRIYVISLQFFEFMVSIK